jgi:N-acetylneuraminic acid mutarotase
VLNDSFTFNIKSAEIFPTAPMHVSRKYHSSVLFKSDIFVVGGYNHSEQVLNQVEKYNLVNKDWGECASLNVPRNLHALCNYKSKYIYAIGGCVGAKSSIERYDPNVNKWESTALNHPLGKRFGMGCIVRNDDILVFGGLSKSEYFDDVFLVNVNAWSVNDEGKLCSMDAFYNREAKKVGDSYYIMGYPFKVIHKYTNGVWAVEKI